jgi:hypothetical protein
MSYKPRSLFRLIDEMNRGLLLPHDLDSGMESACDRRALQAIYHAPISGRSRNGGFREIRSESGRSIATSVERQSSDPKPSFEVHRLKPDWHAFLDDFQRHWPTDEDIYVDFVRDGIAGNGAARTGDARWRRLMAHTVTSRSQHEVP